MDPRGVSRHSQVDARRRLVRRDAQTRSTNVHDRNADRPLYLDTRVLIKCATCVRDDGTTRARETIDIPDDR
jgi:hypothetical protein